MKKIYGVALIAILILSTIFTYVDKESVKFFMAVRENIKQDTTNISLKEITPFEWEKVCYLSQYSIPPFSLGKISRIDAVKERVGTSNQHVSEALPNTWTPNFSGAYIFLRNERVIKKYIVKTIGWGINNTGVGFFKNPIKKYGSEFFLGGSGKSGPEKNCHSVHDVHLQITDDKKFRMILLSN